MIRQPGDGSLDAAPTRAVQRPDGPVAGHEFGELGTRPAELGAALRSEGMTEPVPNKWDRAASFLQLSSISLVNISPFFTAFHPHMPAASHLLRPKPIPSSSCNAASSTSGATCDIGGMCKDCRTALEQPSQFFLAPGDAMHQATGLSHHTR